MKMGHLSDFVGRQIVGARSAGASVTKSGTLLDVPRPAVSNVMSIYTNNGKTTPAKRSSGRKSTLTETDRRIFKRFVSKNYRISVAQVTPELNIHLADRVSTKTVRRDVSFTNLTSTLGLQLLNL
jgi:hypothetical protein